MERRDFIKKFTLLSTVTMAPTFLVKSIKGARAGGMLNADLGNPNRIMVVIELAGGNDGLNTVIPYTNTFYQKTRQNLGLAGAPNLLTLDSEYALHPAMTGFKELWDNDLLTIVQGVGYPNPNRSHFRSRDIWHTAEPENAATGGCLASYFNSLEDPESLVGVNIGGAVPRSMVSSEGSAPSILNVDTYQVQTDPFHPEDASNKNAAFQQLLAQPQKQFEFQDYVSQTILDASASSIALIEGRDNYSRTVEYPAGAFSGNMRTIAQIIAADLGVTVFYAKTGGFDTHANQAVGGNPQQGFHTNLLGGVSQTLKAFYDDMVEMGRDKDIVIFTWSEFGRRLRDNGSQGTDHGTANQMFVIGDPTNVRSGYDGEHPSLAPGDLDNVGDMIYSVDFRSVYSHLLSAWLGADATVVLGSDFTDPSLDFIETA